MTHRIIEKDADGRDSSVRLQTFPPGAGALLISGALSERLELPLPTQTFLPGASTHPSKEALSLASPDGALILVLEAVASAGLTVCVSVCACVLREKE